MTERFIGVNFKEIWQRIEKYPGYFFPKEAEALYGALLHVPKGGLAVELGCLYGKSTKIFGEVSKEIGFDVTVVDAFVGEKDSKEYFKKNVLDVYDTVTLIEGTTDEVSKDWVKEIDLLFIDANHQDEGINNDCINWLPFVKSGGIVAFHDYNNDSFPSVKKRVEEHTQGWPVIATNQDSIMIKRKP